MKKVLVPLIAAIFVLLVLLGIRLASVPAGFAEGTEIAGKDLSGLSAAEARELLQTVKPSPLVVYLDQKKIILDTRDLGTKPRAEQAVRRAEEAQPSRLEQALGIGKAPTVDLSWSFRPVLAKETLALLEEKAQRTARLARYRFVGNQLEIIQGRPGRELVRRGLEEKLYQAAEGGGGVVLARTRGTRPARSTRSGLIENDPVVLLVDKSDFQVTVYRNLRAERSYPVAIGMPGFDTPEGWFRIENKSVDPAWLPPDWAGEGAGILVPGGTPENPLVSRWLGIVDGVGFHGTRDTWSLGSAASHGCLRMDPGQVVELYDLVEVGAPVLIRA